MPTKRIGVLLLPGDKISEDAFKFLILQLNCRQSAFEYEILNDDAPDEFLTPLRGSGSLVNREQARLDSAQFLHRFRERQEKAAQDYKLTASPPPESLILVTLARFDDAHYALTEGQLGIIALGDWESSMAPPTVLEFVIAMLTRIAVGFVCDPFSRSRHLGTRGCLFDFTAQLKDAKFKVLQGFICQDCQTVLRVAHADLLPDLHAVLAKDWIGSKGKPGSPASIVAKLGYDLFLTKGFKPGYWESFIEIVQKEGTKEVLKLVGAVLLAAVLFWLGLKEGAGKDHQEVKAVPAHRAQARRTTK